MARTSSRNCACFGRNVRSRRLIVNAVESFANRRGRPPQQRHAEPGNRKHGNKRKLKAGVEQLLRIAHQQR